MRGAVVRGWRAAVLCVGAAWLLAPAEQGSAQMLRVAAREPAGAMGAVVRSGRLSNGLPFMVMEHGAPARGMTARLIVDAGTLHEADDERGSALLAERVSRRAAAESLSASGVSAIDPVRDLTSETGFEQTYFTVTVRDMTEAGSAEWAMRALAWAASSGKMSDAALAAEAEIVEQDRRAGAGSRVRLNERLWPLIVPGSRAASRLPKAWYEEGCAPDAATVEAFRARWYAPSNMMLVVVADAPGADLEALAERWLGSVPAGEAPASPGTGVDVDRGPSVLLATDGELSADVAQLVVLGPSGPPVRDRASFRAALVDELAVRTLARRIEEKSAMGRMHAQRTVVAAPEIARGLRAALAVSSGPAGSWEALLTDLAAEVHRAVRLDPAERELERARQSAISDARAMAEDEPGAPGSKLVEQLTRAAATGSSWMSGAHRLALVREMVPQITPQEVREATLAMFDPVRGTVLVMTPEGGARPSEDAAWRALITGLARAVSPEFERPPPQTVLDHAPMPGRVEELSIDGASGVLSAWLGNGVRVHHRAMEGHGDRVFVTVTLAGGVESETPSTRGLTQSLAALWQRPAARSRTSAELGVLLSDADVRVRGGVGDRRVVLAVSASAAELERAFEALHLLLSEPLIEAAPFERWRSAAAEAAGVRTVQPAGRAYEMFLDALAAPGDRRMLPLSLDEAAVARQEAAQAWIDQMVAQAPMEVAVVGAVEMERALELSARYLGSLASRGRPGSEGASAAPARPAAMEAVLRSAKGPGVVGRRVVPQRVSVGPAQVRLRSVIPTPNVEQAVVIVGFRGAARADSEEGWSLALAADVLTSRLQAELRDERRLASGIAAVSLASGACDGCGRFWATAVCDPARAEEVSAAIDAAFDALATDGPSEREMAAARARVAGRLEQELLDPAAWAGALASLSSEGRSAKDVVDGPERVRRLEAERVREVFAAGAVAERRIAVVVAPSPEVGR